MYKRALSCVWILLVLFSVCSCSQLNDVVSEEYEKSLSYIEYTESKEDCKHIFKDATCIVPKRCMLCGIEEGIKGEHDWCAATCVTPETCTVCKTINGNANGHKFVNGVCLVCTEKDDNYFSEIMVWIPTRGGTKYHSHSSCSKMKNPEKVTKTVAENRGFTPCKKCY